MCVQVPPVVYLACAAGLFLYQTLDNIDGKQVHCYLAQCDTSI
jgi:hypothetical protein